MKKVAIVILCWLVLVVGVNTFVNKVVSPEVNTSMALEQFANPTISTDTASRLWKNDGLALFNIGTGVLVGIYFVGVLKKSLKGKEYV